MKYEKHKFNIILFDEADVFAGLGIDTSADPETGEGSGYHSVGDEYADM